MAISWKPKDVEFTLTRNKGGKEDIQPGLFGTVCYNMYSSSCDNDLIYFISVEIHT